MFQRISTTIAITVCVVAIACPAAAVVQTKGQQGCINALNKAGAKVAATQGKANAACVKNATKGKESDAQACLTADPKSKVSKAKLKTTGAEAKKCAEAPDFGRAAVGQINAAAGDQEVSLIADVFGGDLTAAIIDAGVDKVGAGCQGAIVKAFEKLAATKMKSFLKCKKDGLKAAIDSESTLTDCFDTVAADAKVAKAIAKLSATVTKKCPAVDTDTAFPGNCVGAGDFATCVDEAVECRFCLTVDSMDNLERDCDLYDNGAADLSCAMLPTTTTTTTTTTTSTTVPPAADWGLECFDSMDCGSSFCLATACQCDDFLSNVDLSPAAAMCFFDCMDSGLMDVTDCRDSCGGSAAPACMSGTAGAGGFTGVVTGPGACEPSGFAASVSTGGSSGELKRVIIDFSTPIDEATLFSSAPPPCAGSCPSPGTDCDGGAPYPSVPLPDTFRMAIGAAAPAADICTRSGIAATACKFSPTGYALVLDDFVCTPVGIDLSIFMSCHISAGGGSSYLHFSTGDFFFIGTWPP